MKAREYAKVINCMGFRAKESAARAKREVFRRVGRNCTQSREWFKHLPIHDMSRDDVFATIQEADQDLHHAYEAGNDRLSCMFCIMACDSDNKNGAHHNPSLYQRLVAMEKKTGYVMHQSRRSLTAIVDGAAA